MQLGVRCKIYGPVKMDDDDLEGLQETLTTIYARSMERFTQHVMCPLVKSWGVSATMLESGQVQVI